MIKINVEIENKSWCKKIKNPKKYFKQKLKKISNIIKFFKNKNVTFTILLTNSLNMKKLNNKFRKKNKSTEILSFTTFSPKVLLILFKVQTISSIYLIYINSKLKKNTI